MSACVSPRPPAELMHANCERCGRPFSWFRVRGHGRPRKYCDNCRQHMSALPPDVRACELRLGRRERRLSDQIARLAAANESAVHIQSIPGGRLIDRGRVCGGGARLRNDI